MEDKEIRQKIDHIIDESGEEGQIFGKIGGMRYSEYFNKINRTFESAAGDWVFIRRGVVQARVQRNLGGAWGKVPKSDLFPDYLQGAIRLMRWARDVYKQNPQEKYRGRA